MFQYFEIGNETNLQKDVGIIIDHCREEGNSYYRYTRNVRKAASNGKVSKSPGGVITREMLSQLLMQQNLYAIKIFIHVYIFYPFMVLEK